MKKTIDEMFLEKIQRIKNRKKQKILAEAVRIKNERNKAIARENKRKKELDHLLKLANENISKILSSPESVTLKGHILLSAERGHVNHFHYSCSSHHYKIIYLFLCQEKTDKTDAVVLVIPLINPENPFSRLKVEDSQVKILHKNHNSRIGETTFSEFQNFEDKRVDAFLKKLSDQKKALDIFAEIIGDISDNEY